MTDPAQVATLLEARPHRLPMDAPSALVLTCPTCGDVPHRVLRGKVGGGTEIVFEGVVRCSKCGTIRSVVTREPRPIEVPVIVSWLGSSERSSLEFAPTEVVRIGSHLDLGDTRVEVTAIETKSGRVASASAREIATVWAKRVDRVRIKVSVNKGQRTVAHDLVAAPDEEFGVGEILDLGRERVLVHRIRTRRATVSKGSFRADEIVRMYGRSIRERTSR